MKTFWITLAVVITLGFLAFVSQNDEEKARAVHAPQTQNAPIGKVVQPVEPRKDDHPLPKPDDLGSAAARVSPTKACAVIYRNTIDRKLNDLTVRETQAVQACQMLGLYH